jgi:hypothetical protein
VVVRQIKTMMSCGCDGYLAKARLRHMFDCIENKVFPNDIDINIKLVLSHDLTMVRTMIKLYVWVQLLTTMLVHFCLLM